MDWKKMNWQKFLDTLYLEFYKKDDSKNKDQWLQNLEVHKGFEAKFIENVTFGMTESDITTHFEFLRYIIYIICKYVDNNDYLNFIGSILFTILEEKAISREHVLLDETTGLYKLLNLDNVSPYFKEKGLIKLSNGSTKRFIQAIIDEEINTNICDDINKQIKINNETTRTRNGTSSSVTINFGKGYKKRRTKRTKKPKKKDKKRRTKRTKK